MPLLRLPLAVITIGALLIIAIFNLVSNHIILGPSCYSHNLSSFLSRTVLFITVSGICSVSWFTQGELMVLCKSIKIESSQSVELKVHVTDLSSSIHHLFLLSRWHSQLLSSVRWFSLFFLFVLCLTAAGRSFEQFTVLLSSSW